MSKKQIGYTLIELMTVLAVIGILATLALPAYQDYVIRSKTTAALAEISPVRTIIESKASLGISSADAVAYSGSSNSILSSLGLSGASSSNCYSYTSSLSTSGASSISCTLKGNPAIDNLTITWSRAADTTLGAAGDWACTTTVRNKLAPNACQGV